MMISESFLSLSLFILFVITISFMLSVIKTRKMTKFILILCLVVLCAFAYSYKPLTDVDLTRLQGTLPSYDNISFPEMIANMFSTVDYMRYFSFWIISKIGDTNLLQVMAALIYYSCIFYIMYDYYKNKNIANQALGRSFLIFMLFGQFIFVICGIRTAIAFSLFSLCVYREFFKDKRIISNTILYIISAGFHPAVIPVIIVRLFMAFFERKDKNTKKMPINKILIAIVLLILFSFGGDLIASIFDKTDGYINSVNYRNISEYLFSFFELMTCGLLLYAFPRIVKENNEKLLKYRKVVIVFLIACIVFSFQYTFFTRYVRLVEIMILPILLSECQSRLTLYKNRRVCIAYDLLFISVFVFAVLTCFLKANMSIYNMF